jgi:hypothetical protein
MTAPDWDDDSPQLRENLGRMLARLVEQATSHVAPRVELAKQWHSTAMAGLDADGAPR